MDNKKFKQWLVTSKTNLEATLKQILPKSNDHLAKAMRYTTLAQGKRLRPLLFLAVAKDLKVTPKIYKIAAAIELIHCYSLIHDDLPCMDNDQLRRGKATCHVKFGEATALLTGDALLTLAFEVLAKANLNLTAISYLAQAIGHQGMILGQMIDINAKKSKLTEIKKMHQLKTGKLIETAIMTAALHANASTLQKQQLSKIAKELGLAFQIADDIKDATGSRRTTGKTPNKDAKLGKKTYVTVLGLTDALAEITKIQTRTRKSLAKIEDKYYYLSNLAYAYFL